MRVLRIILFFCFSLTALSVCPGEDVKQPNVAGAFYPADRRELSARVDSLLANVNILPNKAQILALIAPHAGYEFSGGVAAHGYKAIQGRNYRTVIIIAPSHRYGFKGFSVYPTGKFATPLGVIEVDRDFAQKLIAADKEVYFDPLAFEKEHSLEVQLPFLQKVLSNKNNFRIVPIISGDCDFAACQRLASAIKDIIASRNDVLVVASSDMYHGYDYQEAEVVDNLTLSYLKKMDAGALYDGLSQGRLQLCGGLAVVTTILLAKELGYNQLEVLKYANSATVTGRMTKGIWTVGYASCIIDAKAGEEQMLNKNQRKKLLRIARSAIEAHLKTGKVLQLTEKDAVLLEKRGAFVTLHKRGDLRGCIGNLIGNEALYLTIADMAVEAATGDPRFPAVQLSELKDIDIEISVLSPLEKISDPGVIKLGTHGVLVRQGFRSGVFLPQVATETGWSREEFLGNLCAHKAGLNPDAWKDPSVDIYIFTAEIFSEKNY